MRLSGRPLGGGRVEGGAQGLHPSPYAGALGWRIDPAPGFSRIGWILASSSPARFVTDPIVVGVGGIDSDLLLEADTVGLDGDAGSIELPNVKEIAVVTALLVDSAGRVLLLRRSSRVGSFPGRWAGVSGYLEEATPEAQVVKEIREETGIESGDLTLEARGAPVHARDRDRIFTIHPFRVATSKTEVTLDWEHTEYRWVSPPSIRTLPSVPKLDRVWEAVAPNALPASGDLRSDAAEPKR